MYVGAKTTLHVTKLNTLPSENPTQFQIPVHFSTKPTEFCSKAEAKDEDEEELCLSAQQ